MAGFFCFVYNVKEKILSLEAVPVAEILNDAEFLYYYELINGKKFRLPSMTPAQDQIKGHVMISIGKYLIENKRGYFFSNVEVHFDEKNIFVPDFIVVLKENEQILAKGDFVYGVPDMVVEILSRSTKKRDITIKKDIYERNGVREYWIIDPWIKSITVYLLRDGKYELDDEYILFDDKEFDKLTDEEKADVKHEVPVSILDGLKIPLKYIFKWGYR